MIGTTVSHYEILEKLGEGGMGVVWKAQDTRLARFVALKFVPESVVQDAASVERLLREARAASALNHPHICTIYDIDEWEGRRFIVMELLEGVTLREKAQGHPLEIDSMVEIGLQLADALEVAHAKNIIHRDIKSTNIIVSPRGQAKILDFGLAKIVQPAGPRAANAGATIGVQEDLTQAGHAVGTAQSMSPEQALGKEVDGRADLFSLGVVLYEMATGHAAFSGSTSAAVFDAILNKAPVAPVTLNPAVPVELSRIINKALEKDRELRYQGAAELATDLKRMRRDSDSRSTIAAAAVPAKSGRSRAGLLAVGAGVVLAAAAIGWFALSRREPAPLPTGTTKPLTGLVGVEARGSWSPDGGFFAYEHTASGPAEIFIAAAGGGDPVRLVEGPADNVSPRWSPDNRWIAFASGRDGSLGIYLVPTLGGTVQKLVDLDAHPLYANAGLGSSPWSADGRSLLYSREDSSGQSTLWTKDIETRVETRLTQPPAGHHDFSGTRSPDGAWIAFSRADGVKAALMLVASDGTKARTVLDDGKWNGSPAWTPDGRSLVYESDRNAGSDLWTIDIDSPRPRAVTSGSQGAFAPSISQSGRLLYNTFTHQTDLYLRDLATGEEKRLTSHTKDNFGGRFSPDGSRIAYFSSRTGNGEIWVLDLAGGGERRLTDHAKNDYMPEWSPDGGQIAFLSDRDGPTQVWIMSAEGGATRKLSERQANRPLRWSPDGARIGFLSFEGKGGKLVSIDSAGGNEKEHLGGIVDFDWYLDSRRAIVTMSQGKAGGEMRAIDLESGARVTLLTDPQGEVQVARDGSALTYCSARSHFNMNLHLLRLTAPAADGLPRAAAAAVALTHGDGEWHVHNGGWSADGKRLVYTRDTDSGDLFVTDGMFKAAGK